MGKFWILALLFLLSCGKPEDRIIVLQPLGKFDSDLSIEVMSQIKNVNPNVVLRKKIDFPKGSYNEIRDRYRADSIIKFLTKGVGKDSVIVGLASQDISTTKGKIQDWGIMGLGYRPGNACVVSNFRLSSYNKNEQLHKVILHELGHTEGLSHCAEKTYLMRDAEGGNHLDEEKNFCADCSYYLKRNGWKLK